MEYTDQVEKKSKEIIQNLKKLVDNYPGLSSIGKLISIDYLLIKMLNKKNFGSLYHIINTMYDKDGKNQYVLHGDKTVFFDPLSKTTIPWFEIKKREFSFSYRETNFHLLYQFFKGNEVELIQHLDSVNNEIMETIIFFKAFIGIHNEKLISEKKREKMIDVLMKHLNKDSQLILMLTMDIDNLNSFVMRVIEENKGIKDYQKEVTEIFETKLEKILLKEELKNNSHNCTYYNHDSFNYQNQMNVVEFYKNRINTRSIKLKDIIEKTNLYFNLNDNLKIVENKKRVKI